MLSFEVYPAIDLRQGRVVRLRQGDPAQETEYATDPLAVACRWRDCGARWLHVVNLDGALDEPGAQSGLPISTRKVETCGGGTVNLLPPHGGTTNLSPPHGGTANLSPPHGGTTNLSAPHGGAPNLSPPNWTALQRILGAGLRVQFGGGLRDLEALRRVLELGVQRAVLGTAAAQGPELLEAALAEFGAERIAVGIDARAGRVRTHGWQQQSELSAIELARRCARLGVRWIVHTDVARDGMGRGLNVEASRQLAELGEAWLGPEQRLHVIASGGVAALDDVQRAHRAGLSGVIIGRALYEGALRLEDALQVGRMNDAG